MNNFSTFSILFHNKITVLLSKVLQQIKVPVHTPSLHRLKILRIIVLYIQVLKWFDFRFSSIDYHSWYFSLLQYTDITCICTPILPVSTLALIFDTSTDPALWTGDLWGETAGDRGRGADPGLAILLIGAKIPKKNPTNIVSLCISWGYSHIF